MSCHGDQKVTTHTSTGQWWSVNKTLHIISSIMSNTVVNSLDASMNNNNYSSLIQYFNICYKHHLLFAFIIKNKHNTTW